MTSITKTVTISGQEWTIVGDASPNPLAPTPGITASTVDGPRVWINCQYRQITAENHVDGCTWGVDMSPICSCAPRPADTAPLFDAARDVLQRCLTARQQVEEVEEAARLARAEETDVWVKVPPGCDGCASALHGGPCECC